MTATLRASTPSYTSAASDTSFSISMPTGWQPGDVVYIGIECRGTGASVTTPSGWTAVAPVFNPSGQTNTCEVVLRRVMQSGDPSSVTITVVSSRVAAIAIAAVGADNTTPEDGVTPSEAAQSAATNSPVANSVTPTGSDDLLLTFFGAGDPTTANVAMTFTQPSGMTLVAQASTAQAAATDAGIMIASLVLTSNAATGTKTATITPSSGSVACNSQAVTLVIKSAPVSVSYPPGGARRTPYRVQGLPPQRRFRQMLPVPAQLNPPYQFTEIVQRRETWPRGLPRHSRVTFVVPKQLNPPYPVSEVRQWRQPRGLWPRRGHGFAPVPAQQAATPPPPFVWQPLRHPRAAAFTRRGRATSPHLGQYEPPRQRATPRGRLVPVRRGRVVWPPQAQAPPVAPAWVQAYRAPLRALAFIRRRFAQLMPWPQATTPPPPQFSVGALSASDAPTAVLTAPSTASALTAATAPSGTLTAASQRTGGPG